MAIKKVVVHRKLQTLPSLTYALGKESFWVVKNPNPKKLPPTVPYRCLCEINNIGVELMPLRNLTGAPA